MLAWLERGEAYLARQIGLTRSELQSGRLGVHWLGWLWTECDGIRVRGRGFLGFLWLWVGWDRIGWEYSTGEAGPRGGRSDWQREDVRCFSGIRSSCTVLHLYCTGHRTVYRSRDVWVQHTV